MAGGRTFPVAFRAWDGDNAEVGNRGAISSWYFLHLREPTPVTAYVAPVVALLLTALLGLVVIRRAKAREEEAPTSPSVGARPAGATAGG
jgi:hypothetical protein